MKDVLKMVYGDQKEVELKSQVFEFGVMQDILSDYKKGVNLFQDAKGTMDRAFESLSQAKKAYDELEAKTKQLGIEVPNDTKKVANRLNEYLKEAQKFK